MITAYYLITTTVLDPVRVAQTLLHFEEVENCHQVAGDYDLIVRVTAQDLISLKEDLSPRIEATKGVSKATLLIVEE
ncbi:MAG TPA: Lrp/AsnC ligand binding domain-containing protein [Candidatus Nanoarchaeia archaeon]|nr:Lrp/AsnC ligand binding domain-containing protein [Candidatus Nanoarchaeia archaeon]